MAITTHMTAKMAADLKMAELMRRTAEAYGAHPKAAPKQAAEKPEAIVFKNIARSRVREILALTADLGPALLFGPPGTGKTTDAMSVAAPNRPVYVQTFTAEMSKAEVIGHWIPVADKWEWSAGPGMRAWVEGGHLVLNEVDHASEDVSNILHAWLDTEAGASYTLPDGRTLRPHPNFRAVATMNGHPTDLNAAVRDRFKVAIYVGRPSDAQLDRLSPCVRQVCADVYRNTALTDLPRYSYRELLSYVDMRRVGLKRAEAAVLAFDGDKSRAHAFNEVLVLAGASPKD